MGNAEMGQALLGLMEKVHVIENTGSALHMGRQGGLGGADRPDMEMVHIGDPGQRAQGLLHRGQINTTGDRIESHPQRFPEKTPATPGHRQPDAMAVAASSQFQWVRVTRAALTRTAAETAASVNR